MRRNWNRWQPTSLRAALQGCKDYAQARHNLSVERIAERMGLDDHWVLYKWIANGRMPAVLLPAYEHACGINLVARWMAVSDGKLLVDMPTGHAADSADLIELSTGFQHADQLLSDFYKGNGADDPAPVLEALRLHLQGVAFHHANVAHFTEPELDFAATP